jgi:hypothetical protein
LFWPAAVFGDKLPANWNRCHHPRHHHMRQRQPHTMHRGHMNPRHILEPNHMHRRHPQTHNMKTEEDMKTEEGEGIVKAIRPLMRRLEIEVFERPTAQFLWVGHARVGQGHQLVRNGLLLSTSQTAPAWSTSTTRRGSMRTCLSAARETRPLGIQEFVNKKLFREPEIVEKNF